MNRTNKGALPIELTSYHTYGASGLWPAFAFHACKMIVLAIILTKSPLQKTFNTCPRPSLLCELGVVASYFDDDAVVSAIGLIFNGIAGPWYTTSLYSVIC